MACVKVNDNITQWFDISSGVRQGDSLSPILFGFFINDLIGKVKTVNLGVNINNTIISTLTFADDFCNNCTKRKRFTRYLTLYQKML